MSQVHYPCKWYKVKSTSTAIFREKSLPHLWQSGSRQQSIHASPRSLRHLGETEVLPGYCWCTWSIDWEQSPARSLPLHHGQRGCLRGWPRFVHVEDSLRAEGWKKPCFKPWEFPDSDCQIWWIKTPIKDPYGVTDCIHPQPSCALPLHLISPTPESSGAPLLTLVNGRSSNIIFGQPIQSYIKSIKSYNILAKHPNSSNAQLSNLSVPTLPLCRNVTPASLSFTSALLFADISASSWRRCSKAAGAPMVCRRIHFRRFTLLSLKPHQWRWSDKKTRKKPWFGPPFFGGGAPCRCSHGFSQVWASRIGIWIWIRSEKLKNGMVIWERTVEMKRKNMTKHS